MKFKITKPQRSHKLFTPLKAADVNARTDQFKVDTSVKKPQRPNLTSILKGQNDVRAHNKQEGDNNNEEDNNEDDNNNAEGSNQK